METNVAVIAVIVREPASVESVNAILHEYSDVVIGRMGVPYRSKSLNIISVAVDAPQDTIDAAAEKLSALEGVSVKTVSSAD